MSKNIEHIQHKRNNLIENEKPKFPTSNILATI